MTGIGFIETAGGTFLPYLTYNAQSGDMSVGTSVKEDNGEWRKEKKYITFPVKFIFDFSSLEKGWMKFESKMPPVFHAMVPVKQPMAAQPPEKNELGKYSFSQGFRLRLYSSVYGLIDFCQSSATVRAAMNNLYLVWDKDRGAHPGKEAVVEIRGTNRVTGKDGKVYKEPDWAITGWVPRPKEMDATPAPAPEPPPVAAIPANADFGGDDIPF